MTFNDDLQQRRAIYLEGRYIPLSQVTFEQLTDEKAIVPNYELSQLPAEVERRIMAIWRAVESRLNEK